MVGWVSLLQGVIAEARAGRELPKTDDVRVVIAVFYRGGQLG